METVPIAMGGKVVEKITEIVINGVLVKQFNYVFCFTSNLHNFRAETEKLKNAQDRIQDAVRRAQRNGEDIEKDVSKWLADVEDILSWKETTERKIKETEVGFLSKNFKYRLSRKLTKKTVQVKDLISNTPSGSVGRLVQPPPLEFSGVKADLSDSSKAAFDHIVNVLQNDTVQIIGLYGMGGVGKTTLVERIGQEVAEHFDKVLMVVFSKSPDIRKMQDKVAGELGLKFDDGNDEKLRASRLLSRWKQEKSILVILDDVWKEFKLRDIGIEMDASQTRCKYIVTTRDMHVCEVMGCQEKVELKIMTESETWALFKEKAELDDDSPMAGIAAKVAKKCGGLPIAIVTLASALKRKSKKRWKAALKKLDNFELIDIDNIDEENNAYMCIKSSYDELKNDLQMCLLLCSFYAEDSEISPGDLVELAGTELKSRGNFEDRRNLVASSIETLVDKCLLVKCGDETHERVKMHDMIRHFSLWILSKPDSIFRGTYIDESSDPPTKDMLAACMMISINGNQNIILPSGITYPNLRVLDVCNHKWESMSNAVFEVLTNLRSLHLVNCSLLDDMSSLRGLVKIEILSFRGSAITQLPDAISEMQHLKLLDLSYCWKLTKVPDDLLKRLLNLEELYTHGSHQVWGGERSNLKVSELKELKSLKRLSLELEYTSLPQGFVFPKLKWYYIHMFSNPPTSFSNCYVDLPPPNTLKFVNVESTWKNVFGNLLRRVIHLEVEDRSGEIECIIPYRHHEGLNKLEFLKLSYSTGLKWLVNKTELKEQSPVFSSLAKLKLSHLPELRCLWEEPTPGAAFRNLTAVSIIACDKLTFVFSQSVAQSLVQLRKLRISCCHDLEDIIMEEDGIVISLDQNQNQNQNGCFGKLERLDISECPKLKYIMSIALARGLERLAYLREYGNSGLKMIFGPEEEEGSSADIVLPLLTELVYDIQDHINHISSPSLQKLTISEFDDRELNRLLNGKQLERLTIEKKAEIWYHVLAMLVKQQPFHLKQIIIAEIDELCQIFHLECLGHEEPRLIDSIEALALGALYNLRDIWGGCIYTPNLRWLYIIECKSLRYIFSPNSARNLPLLELLKIENCGELEAIIGEDKHGESDHPDPTSCFPNLEIIIISGCKKLKHIFPISFAVGGLSKLSTLQIASNYELDGIFEGAKERDDTKILELPLLTELILYDLPELKRFSPVGYHFILPGLNTIGVNGCDKVATTFTIASDGSVHAQSKDNSKMLGPGFNLRLKAELPHYLENGGSSSHLASESDQVQENSR